MPSYQDFTSTRLTEPDQQTLLAQLRANDATIGVQHTLGTSLYRLKKETPWTGPQVSGAQVIIDSAPETTPTMRFQRTSREKDVLATCALVVRSRNITSWNAMTNVQKRDAVLAEADVWVNIREFLETNA